MYAHFPFGAERQGSIMSFFSLMSSCEVQSKTQKDWCLESWILHISGLGKEQVSL